VRSSAATGTCRPGRQVAGGPAISRLDLANWKLFVIAVKDGVLRVFHVSADRGVQRLLERKPSCEMLRSPTPLGRWPGGELRHAPWFGDDAVFPLLDWRSRRFAVETWRGLIFFAIAPETILFEQLRRFPERSRVSDR